MVGGRPAGCPAVGRTVELDELVEHWTLLGDEQDLVAGKRDATRLGFALQLKFYARHGGSRVAGWSSRTKWWTS